VPVAGASVAVSALRASTTLIDHRSPFVRIEAPEAAAEFASTRALADAGPTVRVGGTETEVLWAKFRLLAALARNAGMVTTHRQLLTEVWGPTHAADTHYLRVYMKQLRDKLEPDPVQPRYLLTETGIGYRLVAAG
jgi:DNA-binding response OmpR family regulator